MSLEMEEVEESPVEESTNSTTQSLSNKLSTLKLNRINNLNNENKNMDNTNKATGQNGGSNTGGVNYSDFSFTRADLADAVALLDDGSSNLVRPIRIYLRIYHNRSFWMYVIKRLPVLMLSSIGVFFPFKYFSRPNRMIRQDLLSVNTIYYCYLLIRYCQYPKPAPQKHSRFLRTSY